MRRLSLSNWRARLCTTLSLAIAVGFWAFFVYSLNAGISKQSVFTGPVGYWLGAYLLFATVASTACLGLLVWMLLTHSKDWKASATVFVCSWLVVIASYWLWHGVAQSRYEAARAEHVNAAR